MPAADFAFSIETAAVMMAVASPAARSLSR
jgi:hypothetical protein